MNRAIIAMALASSLYACSSQPADKSALGLNPPEAENVRHVIVAWLECHECTEGELGAVKRLGQLAVPTLTAVLKGGPSPATLEAHREHLAKSYRQMVDYAKRNPDTTAPALSEQDYLDLYTGNLVALYKLRAAEALREIGGDHAQKALDDAANDANREDVTARVKELARRGRR